MELKDILFTVLTNLAILMFVVEAITEIAKKAFKITSEDGKFATALVVGVVFAFVVNIEFVLANGFLGIFGALVAGALAARGGNYLHEAINVLRAVNGNR